MWITTIINVVVKRIQFIYIETKMRTDRKRPSPKATCTVHSTGNPTAQNELILTNLPLRRDDKLAFATAVARRLMFKKCVFIKELK